MGGGFCVCVFCGEEFVEGVYWVGGVDDWIVEVVGEDIVLGIVI